MTRAMAFDAPAASQVLGQASAMTTLKEHGDRLTVIAATLQEHGSRPARIKGDTCVG